VTEQALFGELMVLADGHCLSNLALAPKIPKESRPARTPLSAKRGEKNAARKERQLRPSLSTKTRFPSVDPAGSRPYSQ
jgi:hypothetical protein